ncbi:hypothetical protein [Ferviditalea candida]|uniref:Uncharacterized protein n=1 Tax=Ferviditalea candida TaxID=3108399 RepID=A0ABU5ZGB6_9BACL|nr:hypothetical protein [Paenibacillaceae bacterium T2]
MAKKIQKNHSQKQVKIKAFVPYEVDYACGYDWFPYYYYGYPYWY